MREFSGPHDYFSEDYVRQWAEAANIKRPFRVQFFELFAAGLNCLRNANALELGCGPGFLAEYILSHCDIASSYLLTADENVAALRAAGFDGAREVSAAW